MSPVPGRHDLKYVEMILLSEVSQTEKDKYHMISLICGILKMIQMNLFTKYTVREFGMDIGGSEGKASACSVGDVSLIPGSGRSRGEGNGNPLQCSCLENPTDRGAWWATVYGVAKSQTRLSEFTSLHFTSLHVHTATFKMHHLQGPTAWHRVFNGMWQPWMGGEFGGEWIHQHVCWSPFAVRLELSQHRSSTILQYKIKSL